MPKRQSHTLYRSFFLRFFLYNLIFLSLQFGFIFAQGSNFTHALLLPIGIYLEITGTLLVHLGLYFLLSIIQTALLWGVMKTWPTVSISRWQTIILWLSIIFLLTCNGYFFPLSVFSRLLFTHLPHFILNTSLILSFLGLVGVTLLFIYRIASVVAKQTLFILLIIIAFVVLHLMTCSRNQAIISQEKSYRTEIDRAGFRDPVARPHIILIGIDSLPPNVINQKDTPAIAQFISHSVEFKETISPLAHTYPAWTSILTGLYPQHHQARYNLMPPDRVKSTVSIAWQLQQIGYRTLFATDDRRFNNIGTEFGFQTIIGPKLGVNDFLLGTFNDYPLSNLIINFPISQRLFPYNYINRASHFSYYPQFFDQALNNELAKHTAKKPAFIAVHFTLPHWPYAFATSSATEVEDEFSVVNRGKLYLAALKAADNQVAHFLERLQENGYLNNSLIILLSDHGETFYVPGSRHTKHMDYQGGSESPLALYFKRKTSTALDMSAGHGSDLLSPDQYRCLLAFTLYQNNTLVLNPHIINTRVALIDIEPTILDFLSLKPKHPVDGLSLLTSLFNPQQLPPQRAFIMESGMLPNQFLSRNKARQLAQQFFIVDKVSGQLQLRQEQLATLDAMKLYGIIEGDWVFALYPDDKGYIPIIQRLSDGKWVDTLSADFAKNSPALGMLKQIREFYHSLSFPCE